MAQLEVLPVPPSMVPQFWRSVRCNLRKIPGYNVERTHMRLIAGMDQLWLAFGEKSCTYGVIITSISHRPPQERKAYMRKDPALMRSLTIHIVGRDCILSWIDSAIERINLYARQNGCHMLFILARKGWQRWLKRWYSKEWEVIAIGRDRPTVSKCRRLRKRNTPGYFRQLVPIPAEKWDRYRHTYISRCEFKEVA